MAEAGDELQETNAIASLDARRERIIENVDNTKDSAADSQQNCDDYEDEQEHDQLCDQLRKCLEDIPACDMQLSLFSAASSSYRQDSTLRPFPPMFLKDDFKDVESLAHLLNKVPHLETVKQNLDSGFLDLDPKLLKLLVWVLRGGNANLKLRSLSEIEKNEVLKLKGIEHHPLPNYILEVSTNQTRRWRQMIDSKKTYWAFHGSRLDNFYSILNYGLQQHLNKTGLFGEGIYLCEDLGVCLTYSSQGLGWIKSRLGQRLSCVAVAQVLDHPDVKLYSDDTNRGRIEGSEGGRVPDKYMVIRNNDLVNIRYILVYKHGLNPRPAGGQPRSSSWVSAQLYQHRMVLFHLAYILLLAAIGLCNSTWIQRWLRKLGWKEE